MEKKQQFSIPISDENQINLIRATFRNNDELLKIIKDLFFGYEISKEEKELVKSTFANEKLRQLMWDKFYPQHRRELHIANNANIWKDAEQLILGANQITINQEIGRQKRSIEMVKQALELLENPDGERVKIKDYDPEWDDELKTQLLARNRFMRLVTDQLTLLWIIANQEEKKSDVKDNCK